MKTYIKGDAKEILCIEDSKVVLITSPAGEPLILIKESDGSVMVQTPKYGEKEFYDLVIAAGFKLEGGL